MVACRSCRRPTTVTGHEQLGVQVLGVHEFKNMYKQWRNASSPSTSCSDTRSFAMPGNGGRTRASRQASHHRSINTSLTHACMYLMRAWLVLKVHRVACKLHACMETYRLLLLDMELAYKNRQPGAPVQLSARRTSSTRRRPTAAAGHDVQAQAQTMYSCNLAMVFSPAYPGAVGQPDVQEKFSSPEYNDGFFRRHNPALSTASTLQRHPRHHSSIGP